MEDKYIMINSETKGPHADPANTGGDFRLSLPDPYILEGSWECAVVEFSFIYTRQNVYQGEGKIIIFDWLSHDILADRYGKYHVMYLSEGYYENGKVLAEAFNELVWKNIPRLNKINILTFNELTHKMHYKVEGMWLTIALHGSLLFVLGCNSEMIDENSIVVIGRPKKFLINDVYYNWDVYDENGQYVETVHRLFCQEPDIIRQETSDDEYDSHFDLVVQITVIDAYILYADFLERWLVGGYYSNMLRILPVENSVWHPGTRVLVELQNPIYLKVAKGYLDSIRIQVLDWFGRQIKFPEGINYALLHLRKKGEKEQWVSTL